MSGCFVEIGTKTFAPVAVGLTAGTEIVKSVQNGDTLGECTGHVLAKGTETALSTAAAVAAVDVVSTAACSLVAGAAMTVAAPVVVGAGIGASLLAGGVVKEVTNGAFDEIGEGIGDVVDNVAWGVSYAAGEVAIGVVQAACSVLTGVAGLIGMFM